MRSSIFCDNTQRRLLITNDVSRLHIGPIFNGQALTLEDGPMECPETLVTNNLRCVRSQKSEDFIYIVAEA
jgi:hypothetical protein